MKQDLHEADDLRAGPSAVSGSVYVRRMHDPRPQRRLVGLAARMLCHSLVLGLQVATVLARLAGGLAGRRRPRGPARMVLTGTFFADSWVQAHVAALALAARCDHIWVVADRPFGPMRRVSYVCPPRWLQRLCGRVPARSLLYAWVCLRRRPDVVGGFHLLCNGLLAQLVARLIGARAMYFCVGGWAEFLNGAVHGGNRAFTRIGRPDPLLERRLLRSIAGFDLILTMGTKARAFLRERGIRVPIEVMPGGIDGGRYDSVPSSELRVPSSENRVPAKKYDLITVCRVEPVKRIDVLLEAVRLVAQRVPGVRAVIVGDGAELEALQARARDLGLEQHVEFAGRHDDVERWLAASRVFVLTSDSEGLSLALMEAVTAGLPAVVSDVGDLGDLIADGINGFRPPPRRPDLFAQRIGELLEDHALCARFSAAAKRCAQSLSVESMTRRWDHILGQWCFKSLEAGPARLQHRAEGGWPSRKQLWESSRGWHRSRAAGALAVVPPAVWLGRGFRQQRAVLDQSQWWDAERLAGWQLKRLQRLVRLAWERCPFYRRLWRGCGFEPDDLRCLDDLAALPAMDRSAIDSAAEDFLSVGPGGRGMDYVTTGGTGGAPLRFGIDRGRSVAEFAHLLASWGRAGHCLGEPLAVIRGRAVESGKDGLRHEFDPLLRHHWYSGLHLGEDDIARYMEHLQALGPFWLHVYPSVAVVLARWLQRSGRRPPPAIRGLLAESEIVYAGQRELVQSVFGCRLFACYGQSEKLVLAAECEHSSDYHVWPTYGYFELLDEAGRPVRTPGQRGEIVGTGFLNTVMPFVRYRTGDHATYVAGRCQACGRNHPLIRDISGHRVQEMLDLADGSAVPWAALNVHDDTFRNVRRFQFFQERAGQAVLRIVPAPQLGDTDGRRILHALGQRLSGRLDLTLELVGDIASSPRGKAVYVDRTSTIIARK